MKLNDIVLSFMRIVGDNETPNENCEHGEADFALIEIDNEAGEIDKKTATLIKKRLEYRGNVVESSNSDYWLIYSRPSSFRLGDITQ